MLLDPDPDVHYQYGSVSGSRTAISMRIRFYNTRFSSIFYLSLGWEGLWWCWSLCCCWCNRPVRGGIPPGTRTPRCGTCCWGPRTPRGVRRIQDPVPPRKLKQKIKKFCFTSSKVKGTESGDQCCGSGSVCVLSLLDPDPLVRGRDPQNRIRIRRYQNVTVSQHWEKRIQTFRQKWIV